MHNRQTDPGFSGRAQCTRAAARVFDRGVWGVSTATTTVVIRGFCVVHFPTQIGEHRRERDKEQPKNRGWMPSVLRAYLEVRYHPTRSEFWCVSIFMISIVTYRPPKSPIFTPLLCCLHRDPAWAREATWVEEAPRAVADGPHLRQWPIW